MPANDLILLLKRSDFFGGLSEATLRAIAGLCTTQSLKKDAILFTEGAPGEHIYLLASGSLRLFKVAESGKESFIHFVHPGDLFAEVVLFEKDRYPVTAIASTRSQVIAIPKNGFLDLLADKKPREEFLRLVMHKLRLLTRHIRRLTTDNLEQRFFGFLDDHFGAQAEISPKMTKQDMATAMGVTPEAFSRFLGRMKKTGRLSWEKNLIRREAVERKPCKRRAS